MSKILAEVRSSFYSVIFTIILGYLFLNSDQKTRQIIAYTLYILYTAWSSYGVWEVTKNPQSVLMWMLVCSIGFSFIYFVFIDNKMISTWIFYITILFNLLLLCAGIGLTILGTVCEGELAGNTNVDDDKKPKNRFYILSALVILFLLIEGYNTIAFIAFIVILTINNHYTDLHIGDLMYCV